MYFLNITKSFHFIKNLKNCHSKSMIIPMNKILNIYNNPGTGNQEGYTSVSLDNGLELEIPNSSFSYENIILSIEKIEDIKYRKINNIN
jgi:hypothetical protein